MKLVASLIATAALGLSMLVAVPSPATAAPPYPGTVRTTTNYKVPSTVKKKKKLIVRYRVKAPGNAHPRGIVKFRVYKFKNGKRKMVRLVNRRYVGPKWTKTSLGKFKKTGRYSTKAWFRPNSGSVYKPSSSGFRNFRVKRR